MNKIENKANEILSANIIPLDSSDIIAICVVIIALSALGVSLWQGVLSRRHNHLSVKPHLCTEINKVSGGIISCEITNHGVGPAFISSLCISCDGKIYSIENHTDYKNVFNLLGINLDEHGHIVHTYDKESAIAQGKSDELFSFPGSNKDTNLNKKLIDVLPRLHINLEYKCIYGNNYSCTNKL